MTPIVLGLVIVAAGAAASSMPAMPDTPNRPGTPSATTTTFSNPYAAYAAGAYDQAAQLFLDAQVEHPKDSRLTYNAGAAYFKAGNYSLAERAFARAAADADPKWKAQALYNLGNALAKENRLDEAATRYEEALRLLATDEDAKHNLEVVRRELERQKQEQQQQQQGQQDKQDQPPQQQQQQQQQDQQDKQGQQDKQDQQQSQQAKRDRQQQQPQGQQGQSPPQDQRGEEARGGAPQERDKGGSPKDGQTNTAAAAAETQGDKNRLSRQEAELYLQQLGDPQTRPTRHRAVKGTPTPRKDW